MFALLLSVSVVGGAGSDMCCDCMRGDGGPGSCSSVCKGTCKDECFTDIYAYNKCLENMAASCEFPSTSTCPLESSKVVTSSRSDLCCDCMRNDGGPRSCSEKCKGSCKDACFTGIYAYNKCLKTMADSCDFPEDSACPASSGSRQEAAAVPTQENVSLIAVLLPVASLMTIVIGLSVWAYFHRVAAKCAEQASQVNVENAEMPAEVTVTPEERIEKSEDCSKSTATPSLGEDGNESQI